MVKPSRFQLTARVARRLLMSAALLHVASAPAAHTADVQPLAGIREAVHAFAEARLAPARGETHVEVGKLDPRLQLAACGTRLDVFLPPGSGRSGSITVGVRCRGPKPWVLYVPVRVRVTQPVAVLARPLPRGHVLVADDLRMEPREVSGMAGGYYEHAEEPAGQVLRRALGAGSVLSPGDVQPRMVVRRGERVVLAADAGGVTVRMAGEALADGPLGARVRVRNLTSERVVEGIVADSGVVEVPL